MNHREASRTDNPKKQRLPVRDDRFSMLRDLKIVPARFEDLDTVLGILDEAAAWIINSGFPNVWRPGQFSRETFTDQISRGEVFIGLVDERPAGTFVLQWSDVMWWGERPPDAGYVHKFAVRPEYAGEGIGLRMLRWTETQTKATGKRFLRLNCLAEDRKIRDYYERAGFIHKGDVMGPKAMGSLYEKVL